MAWLWNKDLMLPWNANFQLGDRVYKQNMSEQTGPEMVNRFSSGMYGVIKNGSLEA